MWLTNRVGIVVACVLVAFPGAQLVAGDYVGRTEMQSVIESAVRQGVDRRWAEDVLMAAERKQSILDAISRPAEKTKPWHEYRQIFITDQRIDGGVVFAQQYADTLAEVSMRTGVPAAVIVAIIGVETYYGRITGRYRVVDALATLAFDYPKRSPFFTRELEHFLVLAFESGKDPLSLQGSYAGAMGWGQFMPSSYRAYARDFDGDAIADIWANPHDAIYSVANYFTAHGWESGAPVVVRAHGDGAAAALFDGGLKPRLTVGELAKRGIAPTKATDITLKATPLKLDGSYAAEYWLGLPNFYVITRYNHSAMYALSVWQLSQAIDSALSEY